MKIRRLLATFGNLKNAQLQFKDGLNIITAPNEHGKSTWCGFIKAMLYGINTSDRDKIGYLSDKTRFRPWDGDTMSGQMDFSARGREITIQRTTKGSALMKQFSAVYTGTSENVQWLTDGTAGAALTGLSEPVFERSAFIRQSNVHIGQTAELEKRISALVSTGDEDTSYTDADARLRAWLRRRNYKTSGSMPKLRTRLDELNRALAAIEQTSDDLAQARQDVQSLQAQIRTLEEDLKTWETLRLRAEAKQVLDAKKAVIAARAQRDRMKTALEAFPRIPETEDLTDLQARHTALQSLDKLCCRSKDELDAARETAAGLQAQCDASPFSGMSRSAVSAAYAEAEELYKKVSSAPPSRGLPAVLLFLLAMMLLAAGIVITPWLLIGTVLLSIAGLLLITTSRKPQRTLLQAFSALLVKYNVPDLAALQQAAEEYIALLDKKESADAAVVSARNGLENAVSLYDADKSSLLADAALFFPAQDIRVDTLPTLISAMTELLAQFRQAEHTLHTAESICETVTGAYTGADPGEVDFSYLPTPLRSKADTEAQLIRIRVRATEAESRYNVLRGEALSQGDPLALRTEKQAVEAALAAQQTECDAINMALSALMESNLELQTRFSPLLSKTAGAICAKLTGNRYESLLFDRSLSASARSDTDVVNRDILSMSIGTADQIYLSLRLAILQLLSDPQDPCPIILDDALVNFDDSRMANALELLLELAGSRQILLFTCQHREADYLRDRDDVNILHFGE